MSILSRYILRQIWVPTLLAAAVIAFLAVAGAVQEHVETLFERVPIAQVTLNDIGRIALFLLPTLVSLILPVTYLLGIMLTFSRMAQQQELTAMRAAGIPLRGAVWPVVIVGALLSGVTFVVQDQVQPWAHRRLSDLVTSDLPLRVTLDMLPVGVMHRYGDWRVYIGDREEDGTLKDITVLQPREDGRADAFYADAAVLERGRDDSYIVLKNGFLIPAEVERKASFEQLRHKIPALSPRQPLSPRYGMTLQQLLTAQRREQQAFEQTPALATARELRKLRIEIGERLSFPLMCLAVSVVAAPLGARTPARAGRTFTFSSGLLIVAGYFILRKLVEPAWIPSLPGAIALAQTPNLLLGVAGVFLISRVDRI